MHTINIALCGYGFIGKIHTIAYETMAITTPTAVVLPMLHTLCSSRCEGKNYYRDVKKDFCDSIDDSEIEIVDICTPDALHFQQGLDAIKRGKNVYIEKPVAQTLEQILTLEKAVEESGYIGQAALVMRFHPSVVAARDLIKNGAIGRIINFKVKILNNSYLDPNRPVNWRMAGPLAAGGSLMDTGVHGADLIRFLIGEVAEVRAETNICYHERYTKSDCSEKTAVTQEEWAFAQIRLVDGASGELETSRVAAGLDSRNYVEIFGTDGYLYIDLKTNLPPVYYSRKQGQQSQSSLNPCSDFARHLKTIMPTAAFDLGIMLDMHSACAMNMMYNVVKGKTVFPETPTFEEAYRSQQIIAAGYQSVSQGGKWIRIL